jgi:hypothetical protein
MGERLVTDEQAKASEALTALGEKLVGAWEISGGSQGKTTYEWMEGGFFLIQRGVVDRDGDEFEFMQLIGHDRPAGAEPSEAITGRLYTSRGDTLTYICEQHGNQLTIWFGEQGSPAYYKGEFSPDGNTLTGTWEWPGGGYDEVMTKV